MKGLSIEQKAKAYDEAIEKLRSLHDDYDTVSTLIDVKEELENIFPELKENEDEIRKAVIDAVETLSDNPLKVKMLAWLEKQGEHAKFRDSIQVGDKVTRNEDGVLVNLSQLNRVAKKDEKQDEKDKFIEKELECIKGYREKAIKRLEELENQCEQKPAEWSEEDEWYLEQINFLIRNSYAADDKVETLSNWLKSLKDRVQPQSTWKPSDEQMEYLAKAITTLGDEGDCKTALILNDLRFELKKLKEE